MPDAPHPDVTEARGRSSAEDSLALAEILDAAVKRDVAAERRDRAADLRDLAAEAREAGLPRADGKPHSTAADDRATSAFDREQAGRDRDFAAGTVSDVRDITRSQRATLPPLQRSPEDLDR